MRFTTAAMVAEPSTDAPAPEPAGLPAAGPQRGAADGAARRISSERLFDGAAEVQIEHHGALYRLKQTSLGKLILTK